MPVSRSRIFFDSLQDQCFNCISTLTISTRVVERRSTTSLRSLSVVARQITLGALLIGIGAAASSIAVGQPSGPVSYTTFQGQKLTLYPWMGSEVAVLTSSNQLDATAMKSILAALDGAWTIYGQITGAEPNHLPATSLNGLDVVAELPDGNTTCGAACSYLGATGTEIMQTYFLWLYNGVVQSGQYDQVLFYEFGRSFWFYGQQLGPIDAFVTGFAIANRFITMDRIPVNGGPFDLTLPYPQFEKSILTDLLNAYLADPNYTWQNTIAVGSPYPNSNGWSAADLAGSMFYRIYSDNGFTAYQKFWRTLAQMPTAASPKDAITNFLTAASVATGRDYSFLFKGSAIPLRPVITVVANAAGESSVIAPNTWIEIIGLNSRLLEIRELGSPPISPMDKCRPSSMV